MHGLGLLPASALVGSRVLHAGARETGLRRRRPRAPSANAEPPRAPTPPPPPPCWLPDARFRSRLPLAPSPPYPASPPPSVHSSESCHGARPPHRPPACARPPPSRHRAGGPVCCRLRAGGRHRSRGGCGPHPPACFPTPLVALVRTRHGQPRLARGTATRPRDTCAPALGHSAPPPRPPPPTPYSPRPRPRSHARTPREGWWWEGEVAAVAECCGLRSGAEERQRGGRGVGGIGGRHRPCPLLTAAARSGEP